MAISEKAIPRLEPKHDVTIRHRAFVYNELTEDIYGEKVLVERLATRGDTIKVSDIDKKRGDDNGSFVPVNVETGEVELDPATATVEELSTWIQEDKPTVNEVVEAAGDDGPTAQRLLDAENHATGNQPRKGVVEGLEEVVARANQ